MPQLFFGACRMPSRCVAVRQGVAGLPGILLCLSAAQGSGRRSRSRTTRGASHKRRSSGWCRRQRSLLRQTRRCVPRPSLSAWPPFPRAQTPAEYTAGLHVLSCTYIGSEQSTTSGTRWATRRGLASSVACREQVKARVDARNALETYCYNMKQTIEDKLGDKLDEDDKDKVRTSPCQHSRRLLLLCVRVCSWSHGVWCFDSYKSQRRLSCPLSTRCNIPQDLRVCVLPPARRAGEDGGGGGAGVAGRQRGGGGGGVQGQAQGGALKRAAFLLPTCPCISSLVCAP